MDIHTLQRHAIGVVKETGKALLERLACSAPVCREKTGFQDLVTNEDLRVQRELVAGLQEIYPEAGIIAEEKDNTPLEGLTWIIDPIDGTTNFFCMQRNFAICVALNDGPETLMGLVYDVAADAFYTALQGEGAWCGAHELCVQPVSTLQEALVDTSLSSLNTLSRRTGHPLYLLSREIRGQRAMGSAALTMCAIAAGDMQLYLSAKLFPWDHAASGLILREAGGAIAPVFSEDNPYALRQTPMIAGADAKLVNLLQKFILEGPPGLSE